MIDHFIELNENFLKNKYFLLFHRLLILRKLNYYLLYKNFQNYQENTFIQYLQSKSFKIYQNSIKVNLFHQILEFM